MQAWWILPNREQRDDVLASDGEAVFPLRNVLDPGLRPEGFSHGVPTELIERCGEQAIPEILFAQRFPWEGGRQLFSVTAVAGVDTSGRSVHLGLVFILEPWEYPRFNVPWGGLPAEDQAYAKRLLHRMNLPAPGDSWARSVRELAGLKVHGPVTNVALERAAVRFDSLYEAGPAGLVKKSIFSRRQGTVAIVLLILFGAAAVSLYERGCGRTLRVAAGNGVVTWHLS
ncbi:MAG TPA: hypothetical protein VEF06_04115 [Bryobacteraceae bacterium]|nr:hypothetical protein [Bryobacteraceae bacterium]